MQTIFDKTLLIANPTSANGYAAYATIKAKDMLHEIIGESHLKVVYTMSAHHAVELAADAKGYTCVIALGGDGVVHEVVNGLMQIPQEKRPVFGVIPIGSGNDFAKSLGITFDVNASIGQLMSGNVRNVDIGKVNDEYFAETVSWGMDAAIAIESMSLRKVTGKTGMALYAQAGYDQILHHMESIEYEMSVDGGEPIPGSMKLLACNNGQTYGGGFTIVPEADITDGIFDICICKAPISKALATAAFLSAKTGKHGWCKKVEFLRAKELVLRFKEDPPCQIDGEELTSPDATYRVSVLPGALRVIFAK
ncbi:MAG: diacylglycerol kinase family lipid kinase [Eggerthellaceae bacterium]|nr:diacylglycerol kinase family lipid kinase [Eggerthellaceae bacterium]